MTVRSIISILIGSFVLSLGLPASAQTVQQLRAQADALETQRKESQKLTGRIKQDHKNIVDNDALPWDLFRHFLPSYEAWLATRDNLNNSDIPLIEHRNIHMIPLLDEAKQLTGGWSFKLAGYSWTRQSSIQSYLSDISQMDDPSVLFAAE